LNDRESRKFKVLPPGAESHTGRSNQPNSILSRLEGCRIGALNFIPMIEKKSEFNPSGGEFASREPQDHE
jgi:hypothetical protein